MSRLPKAPLLEVIFELRWKVSSKNDIEKFQYLHGDLYSQVRSQYPVRESVLNTALPVEFMNGNPVHRFWSEGKKHPLIQVGPGIVTLNTTDETYFWKDFSSSIRELITVFFNLYPHEESDLFIPSLIYIDFLEVNSDVRLLSFINNNLNTKFHQDYLSADADLDSFNLAFSYKITLGSVTITINTGSVNDKNGLIIETKINGNEFEALPDKLITWIDEAHDFCSNLFKEMTKGVLYESFK